MIEVLEPLVAIPGVRLAVLVSADGVPVVLRTPKPLEGEYTSLEENTDSLSGLAAAWLGTVTNSLAPLSWNAPARVVLRAARGTIVMTHAPGAALMVLLEPGATADALRLPMEGTVARLERMLQRRTDAVRTPPSPTPPPSLPANPAVIPESHKGLGITPTDSTPEPTPRQFPG